MTLGKSKKFLKKMNRRKKEDRFLKKSWYSLLAPSCFSSRLIGKTVANIAQSKFKPEDSLKGRRVEATLSDLDPTLTIASDDKRKSVAAPSDDKVFSFKVPERLDLEAISATECLTQFDGFRMTTHKRKSLAKKHQSLIETFIRVPLKDSTVVRVKVICFTDAGKTLYERTKASSIKTRSVRRVQKMVARKCEEMLKGKDCSGLMKVLSDGSLEKGMEKNTSRVLKVKDMFVEKVKVIGVGETKAKEVLDLQHKRN